MLDIRSEEQYLYIYTYIYDIYIHLNEQKKYPLICYFSYKQIGSEKKWILQAYPHKILTGRRSRMHTIRKTSGLAGFPKRDESVYDAFGAGHSSTSISAGLGIF